MHSSGTRVCIPLIRTRWDKCYSGYVPNARVVNSTYCYHNSVHSTRITLCLLRILRTLSIARSTSIEWVLSISIKVHTDPSWIIFGPNLELSCGHLSRPEDYMRPCWAVWRPFGIMLGRVGLYRCHVVAIWGACWAILERYGRESVGNTTRMGGIRS